MARVLLPRYHLVPPPQGHYQSGISLDYVHFMAMVGDALRTLAKNHVYFDGVRCNN